MKLRTTPEGLIAEDLERGRQVLVTTRSTCAWAALGHAVAACDAALTYGKERVRFGKPLCSFQIVQERLVRMLSEIAGMQLYCMQLARLEEAGSSRTRLPGWRSSTTPARHAP